MIIERCTAEHFEDWVRLRQALWPDETIEEHRRYAASVIDRPNDATVYVACKKDGNVIAFAEATLRREPSAARSSSHRYGWRRDGASAALPLMIATLLTRETLAEATSVKSCCHHLRLQRGGPSGPRRQPGTPELDQHPLDTVAA